jgi:GT2 family glycosyltransferase
VRVAVVTIVSGRHEHLRRQQRGLAASTLAADDYIVVGMNDPVDDLRPATPSPTVVEIDAPGRLPLAAARNLGARRAIDAGADLLVFLDVDCIPSPRLLERFAAAAAAHPRALLTGAVGYLPADTDYERPEHFGDVARVHGFRPRPTDGEIAFGRHDLFWSLSFAVTADTWSRLGGFHEAYTGYGGEDTDFALVARDRDVELVWVGGADAFHQHHETQDPPVHHRDDILANGRIFAERWGFWPMRGWLEAFEGLGIVHRDPTTGDYSPVEPTGVTP